MAKEKSRNSGEGTGSGGTAAERARARSAQLREENSRRDKRRTLIVQVSVVLAVIVVVVGGTLAVLSAQDGGSDNATAPANVTDDGSIVEGNPDAAVTLQVIEDFQCPACQAFEAAAGDLLDQYAKSGDVRVEYRGISFLADNSTTQYSSRALNASACVVAEDPDSWKAFHDAMFVNQPPEGGAGLSDDQILNIIEDAGVDRGAVESCVTDEQYAGWAESNTDAVLGADYFSGTPTLLLDGEPLKSNDPAKLKKAVDEAIGR